jgi:hypothetical protein
MIQQLLHPIPSIEMPKIMGKHLPWVMAMGGVWGELARRERRSAEAHTFLNFEINYEVTSKRIPPRPID